MKLSLRQFVVVLSAAAVALSAGCTTSSTASPTAGGTHRFKGPVGLQLYSLRARFRQNVPAAVLTAKGFGIHEVELAGVYEGFTPTTQRALLEGAGLKAISGHFGYDRFKKDPEGIAAEAKALGLQYAGCAGIPHAGPSLTIDEARGAVAVFNHAGEVLAHHGIKCFYHCHGFEFVADATGLTPMDVLIRETKPANVCFQMDVMWVVFPGQDPAAWLQKYPRRWELMHLKDLRQGVPTGNQTGGGNVEDDVALGSGQMNWPVILAAAERSGVKHYFIEDESSAVVTQVPATLKYLETVRW